MVWYDWILIAPIVLGVVMGYRMGLIKNVLYIVLVAITMIIGGLLSQMIVDAIGSVSYTHLTLPTIYSV